jgi:hypothetical protein
MTYVVVADPVNLGKLSNLSVSNDTDFFGELSTGCFKNCHKFLMGAGSGGFPHSKRAGWGAKLEKTMLNTGS